MSGGRSAAAMSATRSARRKCDFWPGVASNVEMVATSRPYYRSTYVFVSRASDAARRPDARRPAAAQAPGSASSWSATMPSNTPPAHALARRGIVANVRGYMLYGDYARPNPPAEIVRAVERGEVDVALVWGPLAGYFAAQLAGAAAARAGDAMARRRRNGRCSTTSRSACRRTIRNCSRRSTACWFGARPTSQSCSPPIASRS